MFFNKKYEIEALLKPHRGFFEIKSNKVTFHSNPLILNENRVTKPFLVK